MFRSGFISIIGRPNVGKSTLLNAILSQKISIATHKPQTTRDKITGIKNLKNAQLIFVDTPGIHKATSKLNKYMVGVSMRTLTDSDLVLFMTDVKPSSIEEDNFILSTLKTTKTKTVLVVNKVDCLKSKNMLLPIIEHYNEEHSFAETFPISALKKDNVENLAEKISGFLPEGPKYFPDDMITDQPEYFFIGEIIREKIFILVRNEIPYSVAVAIQKITEKEDITVIDACIYVERDSQKGIIIGKGGQMLKSIGQSARKDIEKMLDKKAYLELRVRVREKWTSDDKSLKKFGYSPEK